MPITIVFNEIERFDSKIYTKYTYNIYMYT